MMKNISDDIKEELLAAVTAEADDAIGYYDTILTAKQALAMNYYESRPFGNEIEGRSQYITSDVAETCDYMLQSIKRTILQSDSPVEFQAKEAEQEEAAEEATKTINHIFMREQDGDKIINDFLQSGLIEDIGVIKTVCEDAIERKRETVQISEIELAFLDEQDDIEVLDYDVIGQDENGGDIYQARIQTERTVKKYLDIPIPSEEFLFASRTPHEDDSPYIGHRTSKTMSELIEMGFDRETVEGLPVSFNDGITDERGYTRWDDEEWTRTNRNGVMREVTYHEEYIRFDIDDDGIAELVKVCRVENEILDVEEVEFQPFVVWSPFPRAHRMVGNGLAEKVMDIQLVRSLIYRNMIDGFAADNYPRPLLNEASMSENTISDLLNPAAGAPIRYKDTPPQPYQTTFDLGKGASFLEIFNGEKETRTGITRLNQGLDRDALNKTATGTALMQDKGEQFEEYVARNFANAMCKLFYKKMKLIRDNGLEISVRDGGKITKVDPSVWGDMDVVPRIGLGSGNQREKLQSRYALLDLQKEMAAFGSPLFSNDKAYNLIDDIIKDQKLGLTDRYFNDPETIEPQEAGPDPEMLAKEAEAQMAAAKLDGEQKLSQAKILMQEQEAQAKLDIQRQTMEYNQTLMREKAEFEAAMANERLNNEMELAERRMQMEERMGFFKQDLELSKNRSGGDLSK